MEALIRMINNVKRIDVGALVNDVIREDALLQAQIIDWNIEQLYEKGQDSKGDPLGQYAAFTIMYKKNVAPSLGNDSRTDHITLKDTGEFYSSFRIVVPNNADYFEIRANTQKDDKDLAREFGIDILGLDDENMSELANEIKERLIEKIYLKIVA